MNETETNPEEYTPAPYGSSIVQVAIDSHSSGDYLFVFEGLYASEEDAFVEIARWILAKEAMRNSCPWELDWKFVEEYGSEDEDEDDWETLARAWYGRQTPEEIVLEHFGPDGKEAEFETLYLTPLVIAKPKSWKGATIEVGGKPPITIGWTKSPEFTGELTE